MFVTRNVMMKYRAPAGDEGDTGGGSGDGGAAEAAKLAADAAAAEAAAAAAAAKSAEGTKGPTDAEAKLLKEVMDKKNKLKEVAEELAALKAVAKQFEGIDVVAVRAMMDAKKADETKKLEEKGEWDRLRAQMNEAHAAALTAIKGESEASKGEAVRLQNVIAELTVGNSFAASEFIKGDLLLPPNKARTLYGPHFEFKDGAVVAYDKPSGAAERTMLVDGKGDPLGFELALKKLVDLDPDREHLLKSKMKSGSGSKTSNTGLPSLKLDEPRGAAKISMALSKGALGK